MISIKTKLVTLTSIGIFFTAFLLGGLAIWRLTVASNKNSTNALQLICDKEKDKLDSSLGNIRYSVDSMKDVLLSSIGDLNTFAKDAAYREKMTKEFEELFYTIAYHTSSAVSYYVRYNPELIDSGAKGFLWTKRSRFASFSETPLTDIEKYDSNDIEHVGWYYIPVMNKKATWMKPYHNKNLNIYMVSYVVPLYIRGKLLGIVGMDADFTIIIDEINSMNVYTDGFAYITDEQNKIIYHKDYELGTENVEKQNDTQEVSANMNNGWNIVVTVPKKNLHAERNHLLFISIALVIAIVILFILITTRLTKKIITPLIELTHATEQIAEGNFDETSLTVSNDEIGVLTETFKKTLRSLPEFMYQDSVTGLRNNAAYKRIINFLEERIKKEQNLEFSVVLFEVNELEETNKNYEQDVSNQMLIHASKLICSIFVHSPVFRIGDATFVAILEHSDYENEKMLLEQLDGETVTFPYSDKVFAVTLTRGISKYDAHTDTSYSDVYKRAEEAMLENKKVMKNRFRII
ncbi:MAG: diguanylate cyclase [Treponema sp.]|nr:diguanylate cyclase [Treponema sp.]